MHLLMYACQVCILQLFRCVLVYSKITEEGEVPQRDARYAVCGTEKEKGNCSLQRTAHRSLRGESDGGSAFFIIKQC